MAKAGKILFPLLWIIAGALIIISSGYLQQASVTILVLSFLLLLAGGIYFIFHEFNVMNFLFLSPLLFLRPNFNLNIIFVIGMLAVFLIQFFHKPEAKKLYVYYFWLFALLLIAGLRSYLFGIRGGSAYIFFFTECLMPIVVFQVIANSDVTWLEIRRFLMYHVYLAAFLGFIGVILALLNPTERIGSLWTNAMTINGYYVMAFFIGIGLLKGEKYNKKLLLAGLIIIILLGMIFTYTRIVLVGLILGLIIMSLRRPKLFIYLIPMILLIPFLLPGELLVRFQLLLKGDVSIFIRLLVWYYSIQMIIASPVWGVGFDSFIVRFSSLMSVTELRAIHSHNMYLRLLLEMGIVGFVAYMGIVLSVLGKGIKAFKKTKGLSLTYLLWVAIIVELIFCMTDVFIAQVSVSLVFWMLIALMYKISKLNPETTDVEQGVLIAENS